MRGLVGFVPPERESYSPLPQQNGPALKRERLHWQKGPADRDTPTPRKANL